MAHNTTRPPRLHSLDALRGLAAMAVVFYHWQHFSYIGGTLRPGFDPTAQPFFNVFVVLYTTGGLAVDLFFSLSGFVFFLLYAKAISTHTISFRAFALLRLSRLYPLYILTLVLTVILQMVYISRFGDSFVYGNNDIRHFLLNLVMGSAIGLEYGYSFNGPAWSVSVEVFLYLLFYLVCRERKGSAYAALLISAFGFLVLRELHQPMARGVGSFFLGGFVFYVFVVIERLKYRRPLSIGLLVLSAMLWIGVFSGSLQSHAQVAGSMAKALGIIFTIVILFPATILSLALGETIWGLRFKPQILIWLGEISYSSYLLHFPLQLALILIAARIGAAPAVFQSEATMIVFFVILVWMSKLSFRFFESPIQDWIRSNYVKRVAR